MNKQQRNNILSTAKMVIGISESPENSNRQQFGLWYGMNGVKWCAIFVSWVYDKSGCPLGTIDTLHGMHYCPSAYNYFKRTGCITKDPEPGDIVFYDWQGDKLSDHVGIFEEWIDRKAGKFLSIEGNTSLLNQSNGGQVMRRERYASRVLAFVCPKIDS